MEIDNETMAVADGSYQVTLDNIIISGKDNSNVASEAASAGTIVVGGVNEFDGRTWPQRLCSIDQITLPKAGSISESGFLGDIVICPDFLPPQMREAGRTLQQECEYLVTHGILHLLGLDHQEPEEHAEMFTLTDTLLRDWHSQ